MDAHSSSTVISLSLPEWNRVNTDLRWDKQSERDFKRILGNSDSHTKDVCKICCAVSALVARDFIVTPERVQEVMAAYRALKSRVQPFLDYGLTIDNQASKPHVMLISY